VTQRDSDRRRHPRFQCGGEAEVRSLASGISARGKIANLSIGGCLIQLTGTGHPFRRGEAVEMTFCVRQLPLRVQGSVRQCAERAPDSDDNVGHFPSWVVGVQFTLLTERGKRQLLSLIEELAEIFQEQVKRFPGSSEPMV
jgi:hypothetical protein